ncbi:MAG: EFR1 family ferrodoxin [Bacteroidales bacterium]|nr:EFR1 family ferrodoxin [Bacteroidales bacterium]
MEIYSKLLIYYFSGTGNSKNVALWMSSVASKRNIESVIINIAEIDRTSITPPLKGELLVFISPIHGFNYPPAMMHFIGRFPKGENNVLLMNTRAGMLIGNFITPGLTGIAFLLSSLLLKMKGYSIVGMAPFDLPSNWISVHPGLNDKTIKIIHQKIKPKVLDCTEKVLSGKTNFAALREIVQDVIVSPISVMYYLIGRFLFAKSNFASADCNNCDICIKNCPVKAIIKVNNRPFWTYNCESCMKCMSHCPKKLLKPLMGQSYYIQFYFLQF